MWTEEQISRWKLGKFKMAERKDYESWKAGGNKEETLPTEENEPQYQPEAQPSKGDIQPTYEVEEEAEPVRYDDEGETYEFPEWAEGFEDTYFGDFLSDIYREGRRGYRTARGIESTMNLATGDHSAESIAEFVADQEAIEEVVQSAEMRDFQATVEEDGGGFWGVMRGLWRNPSVAPQIVASSLVSMVNAPALGAGATAYGGITAVGSAAGPVGTALSQIAAIPAGVAALSGVTDGSISYVEFMREELGDKDFNEANVQAILKDPEAMSRIRSRATARGVAVGTIDGLTMGLTRSIGGTGAVTRVGRAVQGATSNLSKPGAALVGAGVESVGGATGEAVAQVASGQEISVSDIVLEGIAELGGPGTILNTARLAGEKTGVLEETQAVEPTGDSKPSADLSELDQPEETTTEYRPSEETVNEIESSGIIAEGTDIEAGTAQIQRVAVRNVLVGLEAQGVKAEDVTIEMIEAEIPRIDVDTVSELQAQGIISEYVDPELAVPIIQRIAVDTVNEIQAQAIETEQIEIANQEITSEIEAPRVVEQSVNELEEAGLEIMSSPEVIAAVEIIPSIVVEEVEAGNTPSVEAIVEETVNEIVARGTLDPDVSIETIIPVIEKIASDIVNELTPANNRPVSTAQVLIDTANAEALDVGPNDPQYTIGPNEEPMTVKEVNSFIDSAPLEELAGAQITVENDPPMQAYVADRIQRAQVTLEQEPDTPNLERVVSLELGLRQYEGTTSTVGKLRKAEISKRIKNIASGLPETDGIVAEATEGTPAKQSILPDSDFSPVPKPEPKVKKESSPIQPSLEEKSRYDKKKQTFVDNPNMIGELSAGRN